MHSIRTAAAPYSSIFFVILDDRYAKSQLLDDFVAENEMRKWLYHQVCDACVQRGTDPADTNVISE